jgi:hypothetical protein
MIAIFLRKVIGADFNALKTKILIENNILLEIEKVKAAFKSR